MVNEIERKALAWINQVAVERGGNPVDSFDFELDVIGLALIRAIEQHEAFRQEVSDAVVKATHTMAAGKLVEASGILAAFILPKPVDPLVEAAQEVAENAARKMGIELTARAVEAEWAEDLRAALTKRGLKIVEDK